jgi:hypothetical protein
MISGYAKQVARIQGELNRRQVPLGEKHWVRTGFVPGSGGFRRHLEPRPDERFYLVLESTQSRLCRAVSTCRSAHNFVQPPIVLGQ